MRTNWQQVGHCEGGTSKFRGVSKEKRAKAKPWKAEICIAKDGTRRLIYLGTFAREEDAALAYDCVSSASGPPSSSRRTSEGGWGVKTGHHARRTPIFIFTQLAL